MTTDLSWLGHPRLALVQAPMAGVQDDRLALAACAAGALGSVPAGMLSPDALHAQLARLRAATDAPFNVNFFAHVPPVPDEARLRAWRERLAPWYREAGLDPSAAAAGGASRQPFGEAAAAVLEALPPAVASFHFGLPGPALVARLRRRGIRVLGCATTADEAAWLVARGVDGVIVQGLEAGGHRGHFLQPAAVAAPPGQDALLPLLRQVRERVGPSVPLVAAGGLATPEDVRRALAEGADAVQAGTAYLRCDESATSAVHRAALRASDGVTALTNLFSGGLARGLPNRLMRELGALHADAPPFPLASAALAPLRAWAESQGRGDFSPLWAGTGLRLGRDAPAAAVTAWLAEGLAGSGA